MTRSQDRAPHAPEVLSSPLFAATRPGSGLEIAWARYDQPHVLNVLGYEPVRAGEIEQMQGGQYVPSKKDVGVYGPVAHLDKNDPYRVGELLLMKLSQERKAARLRREQDRMQGIQPARDDKAQTFEVAETDSTLGAELQGKG